ncbi:serine/arginine repetitive matrix protein 1 isoform X2 [Danaus plexippus]|uniref:serine/arginine repetitive matrix protein 1 isoform X2 n=1 Tax=Danaus plexippus TaxID=13037 RepID=UPI002AB0E85F|nr:serine/arginine repetitive matrix protein 1 isoform X2 [Danaus plexippus]
MVVGISTVSKLPASQRVRPSVVPKRELSVGKSFAISSLHIPNSDSAKYESGSEAGDVIDLGAPRRVRRTPVSLPRAPRLYTPNPRLYPGPKAKDEPKRRSGRSEASRPRRRKRKFCRPVPNSRLYRPAPPRVRPPPPPSPRPRAAWSPPTGRVLESASRVALRVLRARSPVPPPPPPPAPATPSAGRRLVVTLPAAGDARSAMSAPRHSTSPECSDGNDPSSAPSEFLSEFLSAIMRRQYAEALEYCRLILQYEPHNATARGFYPLLRHKLRIQSPPPPTRTFKDETSSSEENTPKHGRLSDELLKQSVETECSAELSASEGLGSGSGACSSLELDSSEPASPRRTDTTDPSDSSSWHCDSGGSHSERDDNGNPTPRHGADDAAAADADLRNDNSPLQGVQEQTSSMSSLQRLRAHFACSIK